MEEIRDVMIKIGREEQVTYKMIESESGHDSFLVEIEKYDKYIVNLLEGKK